MVVVHEYNAVPRRECCADRAHLNTGSVLTVIAKLWYEETPQNIAFSDIGWKSFRTAMWTVNDSLSINKQGISLNPCSEEEGFARNIIFSFTGIHTSAATDARFYIDAHSIIMRFGIIDNFSITLGEE
jgi:hypothetical protein